MIKLDAKVQTYSGNYIMRFADKITRTKSPNFKIKQVSDSFYRGSDPSNNLRELSKKGIKIVLNLKTINKEELEKLTKEAKKNGMKYINIPLNPFNIKKNVKDIISVVNMASKDKPMFVHCTFGRDRTGFVTAIYRHLKENLSINDAIKDMYQNGFRKVFFPMEQYLKTCLK